MSCLIGNIAPQFELEAVHNEQFKQLDKDDFKGKWLVLFFYPLDFTFVCPTEICAFSDRLDEFESIGAQVVGVSVDSQFTHLAWTRQPREEGGIAGLRFPLLADVKREMASAFGCLTNQGVALRALFVIDPDGIVQHATINNLSVGRSVDEVIRVLKACQFVRTHGEVCPADWQPGEETIVPDVQKARDFFETRALETTAA
jgi:peroxiredoxin (alkyl hydroperoxide reductase subunit C)